MFNELMGGNLFSNLDFRKESIALKKNNAKTNKKRDL